MIEMHFGKVFLVGSGPGDPDLLTVKAHRLISECDALVYDSLIPKEVLDLVKDSCVLKFVGKRKGHHSIPQSKTNALLVEFANNFDCVVRLKGGDPFVFGRGGEEAAYLEKHGIPVEVVPGVTAGIAAPAYLGIPVTHRLSGSSVTFVSGHEEIDKKRASVHWELLAKGSDVLVVYMGLHNLQYIVKRLLAGGMNSSTPVVVIQQATVIGQRFLKTSLAELLDDVQLATFSSPSIVLIGKVIENQVEASSPEPANVTMPIPF